MGSLCSGTNNNVNSLRHIIININLFVITVCKKEQLMPIKAPGKYNIGYNW